MGLPPGCPPLPTAEVVLPLAVPLSGSLKLEKMYHQFFHYHPEL
jgi:uncharacterized membrane protein